MGGQCPNVSTTPLQQRGFWQCLPFSWTTLRGEHCWHPIAVMGVVDTFEHSHEQKHMLLFMKSTCLRVPNPFMSNITTVYCHASNFLCPQSETKDTIFRKTTKKR